jgi:outer membrane phospholipase A
MCKSINGCVLTPKKQATQSVIAKFASAHFQLKSEQANKDEFQQKTSLKLQIVREVVRPH